MDCQRTQPFHYLIHEQAKSLLALQELQHEVGALLEFREVVMDTFPNLRQKLEPSPPTQWEPGVKVKRKIVPKTTEGISGVQDSGFSTETNSSNKNEAEEELWNLLDVIQTKGTKLREEVEALQEEIWERERPRVPPRRCRSLDSLPDPPPPFPLDLQDLELLLDKLTRLETENAASRVRTTELQEEMASLMATKEELEEQLQVVLGQKSELNRCVQQLLKGEPPSSQERGRRPLGALDRVLTDPRRLKTLGKLTKPSRKKMEAILLEKNPVELQRHLLVSVVENQVLNSSLENTRREKAGISEKLEKSIEDNEELKFRLEERTIELEGTKAQVRMLERLQKPRSEENFLFLENDNLRSKGFSDMEITRAKEIFESPNNQQILPILALPLQEMSHEAESMDSTKKSPRRRPSRIPLSSPALRKSMGDLGKESSKSTTTVTIAFRKTSPSPSTPSLRSSSNFSNVRARDTLSRRGGHPSHTSEANRSLRSQSESSRSLRSRDSMTSMRREPTPTKMTTPSPASPLTTPTSSKTDTVKAQSKPNASSKVQKTPIPRRRPTRSSPVTSANLSKPDRERVAPIVSAEDDSSATTPPDDKLEKPGGLFGEVRRSFHRRIAEKLALNLSGMKQLLRDGSNAGFSVWNSPKPVVPGSSGAMITDADLFDSIENILGEEQSASIIQSCSFLEPDDKPTCVLDSLEAPRRRFP